MKIPNDCILSQVAAGYLSLQVPTCSIDLNLNPLTATVTEAQDIAGAVEYPDDYFCWLKFGGKNWQFDGEKHAVPGFNYYGPEHGHRHVFGRESGYLYLSKKGYLHFRDLLLANWVENRFKKSALDVYADGFFKNAVANTKEYALQLQKKADIVKLQAEKAASVIG